MSISSLYKKLHVACQQNGEADADCSWINKDQEGEGGPEAPWCFRALASFSLATGGVSHEQLCGNLRLVIPALISMGTNSSGNPD
jgi:hypothetical protein